MDERIESRSNWIMLSHDDLKRLFIYYGILFIISLIGVVLIFWFYEDILKTIQIFKMIVVCSILSSLLGSSIYYIRKLYKACIQNAVTKPTADFKALIRILGANAYFWFRPFVSVALALITSFGIYVGIFILTVNPDFVENNFIILCMVLSFYIGFNNGSVIKALDEKENKLIPSIFRRNKSEDKG